MLGLLSARLKIQVYRYPLYRLNDGEQGSFVSGRWPDLSRLLFFRVRSSGGNPLCRGAIQQSPTVTWKWSGVSSASARHPVKESFHVRLWWGHQWAVHHPSHHWNGDLCGGQAWDWKKHRCDCFATPFPPIFIDMPHPSCLFCWIIFPFGSKKDAFNFINWTRRTHQVYHPYMGNFWMFIQMLPSRFFEGFLSLSLPLSLFSESCQASSFWPRSEYFWTFRPSYLIQASFLHLKLCSKGHALCQSPCTFVRWIDCNELVPLWGSTHIEIFNSTELTNSFLYMICHSTYILTNINFQCFFA